MQLNRLPGWMVRSVGFHTDDGLLYKGSGSGLAYGKKLSKGDSLGMVIDPLLNQMFYTINGEALEVIEIDSFHDLYLSLGFNGQDATVQINTGPEYNFDYGAYKS